MVCGGGAVGTTGTNPLVIGRLVVAAVLLTAVTAGCGDEGSRVSGIVLEVSGDLETVEAFTVRAEDGEIYEFVPAADFTFHGGPISHLSEHVRSGAPVEVVFEDPGGGRPLVAYFVEDG